MPKSTKKKPSIARGNKIKGASQWRVLPAQLRSIPQSEQLFSLWGTDSFRQAPPTALSSTSVWDANDPSRTVVYPSDGSAPVKHRRPQPLPATPSVISAPKTVQHSLGAEDSSQCALHPSSQLGPCSSSTAQPHPNKCVRAPHTAQDYPSRLSSPSLSSQQERDESFDEPSFLAYPSCALHQCSSELSDTSPEPSSCFPSRTASPATTIPSPAVSPPPRPWSSPGELHPIPSFLQHGHINLQHAHGTSSMYRARSGPPNTLPQSHGEGTFSVHDVCSQRRLPPMNFAQVVKPSLERERAQERRVVNVVLPAIRADTCRPSEDQLDFEERGIDAARKSERSSRHRPYRIPSMATGAHRQTQKERRKASENDLPPLRLLINQIEYDEHRRVQMRAQFRFQVPFADKLPIPAAAPMKRSSFTPSRHEDGAGTVASVPVQQPMVSSSLRAPITSVPTSQQLVAGSISLAFFNSRSFVPMHGSPSSSANESRGAGAHAL